MKKAIGFTKQMISVMLVLALVLILVPASASAAKKVKLNKTKVTLKVGKTVTLKLKNNKKKVKWTSSNKKVATVTSKGKVKAKKAGKATITAKVGKKKYKCKVTVKTNKNNNTSNTNNTNNANNNTENNPTMIEYLCDWQIDYDSINQEHRLFFGLRYTKNGDRVASSGNVKVDISNSNGDKVYSDMVSYSKSDFSLRQSSSWSDSPRYLCCIKIPDRDIKKTNYVSGTLSFQVSDFTGAEFDAKTLYISNLPMNKPTLTLANNLPQTFSYSSSVTGRIYSKTLVNSLTYKFTNTVTAYDYKLDISLFASLTYQYSASDRSYIGYKLYDSSGIVVSSGYIASSASINVGDSFYLDKTIYSLGIDDYILEFCDRG